MRKQQIQYYKEVKSLYKVIITTSGTGSRLGALTKKTNKALLPIAGKPAIEWLLDCYDPSVPLVVTLGYLADQVREYFESHHQERQLEFVLVDPYEGPGSSLGWSLLQARARLMCPFIFHACDTIVREVVPAPDMNYAGSFMPSNNIDLSAYRTHNIENGLLSGINEKGAAAYAPIHIGLTGIKDYEKFWDELEVLRGRRAPDDTSLSDVHVVDAMIKSGTAFVSYNFSTWLDTGNPNALRESINYLTNHDR